MYHHRLLLKLAALLLTNVLYRTGVFAAVLAGKRQQQPYEPVRGVNLGGQFVLEPWITPSLFEPWANQPSTQVVDEWSYCLALGKSECQRRLEQHWATWVQESDIYELSVLNINTLRIPIGYWALVPDQSEPYVQGQIPHLRRLLGWAVKYGMRVVLDLHGVPGSQNGFDNSGRRGDISWTKGRYDIKRSLDSLGMLARIANDYPTVVVAIEAVNEPANWGVPKPTIAHFYQLAYQQVKAVAPHVSLMFHDAFLPESEWASLVPGNLTDAYLDTHIYHSFNDDQLGLSNQGHIMQVCADGDKFKRSNSRIRTVCGEFSLATTDCARWLNGFQRGSRWDGTYLRKAPIRPGGTCSGQEDIRQWSPEMREFKRAFAMAQIQTYEKGSGWIFWNFKAENADSWDYIKLAQNGIIPNPPIGTSLNICPL
ncbi:hypothetical protein GGI07_002934 [Coemansia sp. Benny D115]|nr:hypothetical protein GGI07_002934 [Coemansia sp. Benny D115]